MKYKAGGRAELLLGEPINFRLRYTKNILNNEIGTQFLRRFNDSNQRWNRNRKGFALGNALTTEEGFASINMTINPDLDNDPDYLPFLFQPALSYVSAYLGSRCTFQELYSHLKKFIEDPGLLWQMCVRVKRG